MGSWAARAEMEDDFVVALPKQAAAAAAKSESAPAAGRPAKAAPDPARNAGNSAPAGNAAQMPPRVEPNASASARALPASMAGPSASVGGQPKAGEGPVTRAVLKIGPGSCLEVSISNHAGLVAALKQVGEGAFSHNAGGQSVWRFPLPKRPAVAKALEAARGVRCSVEDLHPVPRAFLEAASALPDESACYGRIPAKLEGRLMAFQRDGVRFALRHGGRALIGDEMGLGKTVQALALMAAFRDEWPCLIIVPSSLREQWVDALVEWLGITEEQVHVTNTRKDTDLTGRKYQCLIASYNFLGNLEANDRDLDFRVVIMDEAHYIKNKKSGRSQDAKPFVQKAKRAILLSGTPASARPRELFPLIDCLLPASKVSFTKFGERYCLTQNHFPRGQSFYSNKYDGATETEELYHVLTSCIMIRRLKKDVLSQLPPKRRTQVFLQLDAEAKKQLEAMQKEIGAVKAAVAAAKTDASLDSFGGGTVKRTILDLYYRNAKLKVKAVQEYLKELLETTDQKLLVFAHHKDMLDGIEFIMNKTKQRYMRIDGSVKTSARADLVNDFQNNRDIRAAVLSIQAAGTGLTLTGASVVVFAEYTWTPGDLVQAEDRAHRIGQATSVNIYMLHARGSVDDVIWAKLQSKLEHVGQARPL
ncbi:P-loop containing nucleoside triphosphate hydrolase protein [Coccomyxa subellipsoidea C-169]|uniref:P-loop containing nucleoside triphosphate hydrolase protein n=1 Tax=Coccomyxa subellipsoidea (strain C-169) TaxID=574566 RepID=I0YYC7_COCSC|nr:P-loop containing nucleoside triphosphate hydrolase protein [Coccomyxa subellipsoidea C-169]EIE23396.1 P-loop containing nucleoside triphosphate hydrolase protein [Coccomyxa subellipsoidea C-169]|eukprot:XP_005647940.1 P-loop containing nucleoside triphosphate hydrolase protein [Coccomyxa subellipsoidea C-169]